MRDNLISTITENDIKLNEKELRVRVENALEHQGSVDILESN